MGAKVAVVAVCLTLGLRLRTAESRQALRPKPDIKEDLESQVGFIGDPITVEEGPPCSVDLQKDLPEVDAAQPVYLVPDTAHYWLPNERGYLEVPRGARIELYCGAAFFNVTQGGVTAKISSDRRGTLQPTCLQGRTFLWEGEKYEFKHFRCTHPPKYRVERMNATCASGFATVYRVGYNVTRQRYVEVMKVCHDESTLRTHYSQHRLQPANLYFQRYVKRPSFSKAGHFKQYDINYFYTQNNQRQRAAALLGGMVNTTRYFNNSTMFLARGHLVAKSDQIYASQQQSTFTFFNVAPQWQSFNGGQWAQLEDEVRRFVARARLDVDCYTGTFGTLQMPFSAEKMVATTLRHPFYLSYDANDKGLLPVPMLFYRLLLDRNHPDRGIALIGINNPHATQQQIESEYLICDDISGQVKWLSWIRNTNLKKGYLYACAVQDFLNVVKELPRDLADVREVLTEA